MRIVKDTEPDIAANITRNTGAVFTVATAVYEVFDTAGASVQAEANASITNNATTKVTISGSVDTSVAGFVIDSTYELVFTYTIGSQPLKHRVILEIGEEAGEAVSGNYISEGDVNNWPQGITDEGRLEVIERVEAELERLTKDIFYEAPFNIFRDGNGRNSLALNLRGRIMSVSAIYISGVAMNAVNFTHSANVIHESVSGIGSDDFLKHELNRRRLSGAGLFPQALGNIEIVGTLGWPEKMSYDGASGTFRARETITGANNSYTAKIQRVTPSALWIAGKTGVFENDEVITGGTSEETAAVDGSGSATDPPNAIKEAAIMLARFDNDSTLYTRYEEGSENIAGSSYSNPRRILTGLREVDRMINRFVRKIPRLAVV